MIKVGLPRDGHAVVASASSTTSTLRLTEVREHVDRVERERLFVRTHLPRIWRFLRRLGLSAEDADDATQEIFVIAVAKLAHVPVEKERSFLFGIAVRFVWRHRRSQSQRMRTVSAVDADTLSCPNLSTDELIDRHEARELLDVTLSAMTPELRTTFALYELEEMTMAEIASVTEVPLGTVASRLRRAREQFQEAVLRFQRARQ